MDNRPKFYCWLIGKLKKRRMTLDEISDEWMRSSYNSGKDELSKRTFHRYRDEIAEQMGIFIDCDSHNGYYYYIDFEKNDRNMIADWILSAIRISSLSNMLKYHNKVKIEQAPGNSEYLEEILSAIDKRHPLRFKYRTPYGKESEVTMVPAFVRMFSNRWYVIGAKVGTEDIRTYAFDRISDMEVICKAHKLSDKTKRLLDPDTFFSDCFGVARMADVEPQTIVVRAFYPQNNFFDETPLHESQEKIAEGENGSYADYQFFLRPAFDFKQALLSYGRKVTVLKPEPFRQEMIETLKGMVESYETGRDMLEE